MILSSHGIIGSQIVQATGLLAEYPGAAATYSLRQLTTAYTGSAIRVRRASDNTEQDIGFVSNELDTSALTTFCSGTNGFVKTWYDQSGNGRDATQTTAASQPQIVSSGSVILDNGKPSVQFDGINDRMQSLFSIGTTLTRFIVFNHFSNQNNNHIILDSGTIQDQAYFLFSSTNTIRAASGGSITFSPVYNNTQNLGYNLLNQTFGELSNNGATSVSASLTVPNINGITIGSRGSNFLQYFANFKCQEIIYYASDQSTNRTGIETNINDFYSIY
jgi:hypothetical protein